MHDLQSHDVQCPYCGQIFEALIDGSMPRQSYVEDCEVCCRPIAFVVTVDDDGTIAVTTAREDE
jgi:hypothetical protein